MSIKQETRSAVQSNNGTRNRSRVHCVYTGCTHTDVGIYKIYTFTSVISGVVSTIAVLLRSQTAPPSPNCPVVLISFSSSGHSWLRDRVACCVEPLRTVSHSLSMMVRLKQLWPRGFAHASPHITSCTKDLRLLKVERLFPKQETQFDLHIVLWLNNQTIQLQRKKPQV